MLKCYFNIDFMIRHDEGVAAEGYSVCTAVIAYLHALELAAICRNVLNGDCLAGFSLCNIDIVYHGLKCAAFR